MFAADSFNLDFHSAPYYGEDPQVERHYVSMRSRRQPSVLAFLAQDAEGRAFCYSNADLRKGEEAEEIFRFVAFWKKHHGENPRHLVFDSRLTTYAHLARRMRGYAEAQARHIFRDLIDTPADASVSGREMHVHFHRRAHLPIIIASGILGSPIKMPWWQNHTLRLSRRTGNPG